MRNWNLSILAVSPPAEPYFESTYEELKLVKSQLIDHDTAHFESTYEELKQSTKPWLASTKPYFESTYEELKPSTLDPAVVMGTILSLPMRNWN